MFAIGESDELVHFAAHISPELVQQLFGNTSAAQTKPSSKVVKYVTLFFFCFFYLF